MTSLYKDLSLRASQDPLQRLVIDKLHETLDHFDVDKDRKEVAEVLLRMRAFGYKFETSDAQLEIITLVFEHFKSLLKGLPEAKYLLFIYGTLKRGFPLYHHLSEQTFIAEVKTTPCYRMYSHLQSWYPVLISDKNNGLEIEGEVWEVTESCLAKLDQVEGGSFIRQYVDLQAPEPLIVGRDPQELVETYLYKYKLGKGYVDVGSCWSGLDDNIMWIND